jgi:hypothetical protein
MGPSNRLLRTLRVDRRDRYDEEIDEDGTWHGWFSAIPCGW